MRYYINIVSKNFWSGTYQVFDKGVLEDSEGREVDFKHTVILLTANVGSATLLECCMDVPPPPSPEALVAAIRPQLLRVFPPALLGRMVTVPYVPLSAAVLHEIITLQLHCIGQRLADHHGATLHYDQAVVEAIAARCHEVESGARNVDHILTGTLLPELSNAFLARMANGATVSTVHVSVAETGAFIYRIA